MLGTNHHHTWQRWTGAIALPVAHWKASANGAKFARVPFSADADPGYSSICISQGGGCGGSELAPPKLPHPPAAPEPTLLTPEGGTFRDAGGRLRNADGTFAFDGGTKKAQDVAKRYSKAELNGGRLVVTQLASVMRNSSRGT